MTDHYCQIKELPEDQLVEAAERAIFINPANAIPEPAMQALADYGVDIEDPRRIAVLTNKYWGSKGVNLTVSFMEPISDALAEMIMSHLNSAGSFANIKFRRVASGGQVRITLNGDGFWSYLGIDVLSIPMNQATMSLQGFSLATPEAERRRVIRHEMLHTAGCPHEHQRQEIIDLLDVAKTIAWGRTDLGWNEAMVRSQILTALQQRSIRGTPLAQITSLMCYGFPARITKNNQPIPGGSDYTPEDKGFLAELYPLANGENGGGGETPSWCQRFLANVNAVRAFNQLRPREGAMSDPQNAAPVQLSITEKRDVAQFQNDLMGAAIHHGLVKRETVEVWQKVLISASRLPCDKIAPLVGGICQPATGGGSSWLQLLESLARLLTTLCPAPANAPEERETAQSSG